MTAYIKYPLLAFVCLLCACESFFNQTITVDPPAFEPKIALHVFASQKDSVVRVNVSRNIGIFGKTGADSLFYLPGAVTSWYENGVKKGDLTPFLSPKNIYQIRLAGPLQAGKRYEVRASHPDFPSVRAEVVMPGFFQAANPAVRENAQVGQGGERYSVLEVEVNDESGVRNYYEFTLLQEGFNLIIQPNGKRDTIPTTNPTYPAELVDPAMSPGIQSGVMLTDAAFDGKRYKVQFPFYNSFSHSNQKPKYILRIRNVNEAYYKWSISSEKKASNEYEIFSEPVFIFSNIENGLGVFGMYTELMLRI